MINENADPAVRKDILRRLDETYPWNNVEDRRLEGLWAVMVNDLLGEGKFYSGWI